MKCIKFDVSMWLACSLKICYIPSHLLYNAYVRFGASPNTRATKDKIFSHFHRENSQPYFTYTRLRPNLIAYSNELSVPDWGAVGNGGFRVRNDDVKHNFS